MISGIRETAEWAVRAGFKFIQFFDITEEDAVCVDAYLKSLRLFQALIWSTANCPTSPKRVEKFLKN